MLQQLSIYLTSIKTKTRIIADIITAAREIGITKEAGCFIAIIITERIMPEPAIIHIKEEKEKKNSTENK